MAMSCVIVDDHSGFRAMARTLLERDGFDVVAEAADGVSALAVVARERPDVVLLDIQLPDIDGFEVNRRLRERAGDVAPAVVFVSTREAEEYGDRLAASGARAFIPKVELSAERLRETLGVER